MNLIVAKSVCRTKSYAARQDSWRNAAGQNVPECSSHLANVWGNSYITIGLVKFPSNTLIYIPRTYWCSSVSVRVSARISVGTTPRDRGKTAVVIWGRPRRTAPVLAASCVLYLRRTVFFNGIYTFPTARCSARHAPCSYSVPTTSSYCVYRRFTRERIYSYTMPGRSCRYTCIEAYTVCRYFVPTDIYLFFLKFSTGNYAVYNGNANIIIHIHIYIL